MVPLHFSEIVLIVPITATETLWTPVHNNQRLPVDHVTKSGSANDRIVFEHCSQESNIYKSLVLLSFMTKRKTKTPRTLGSVQTTFRIIDALLDRKRVGVTEVARICNISKGTAHTHLATLHETGFVVKEGSRYVPSLRFFHAGHRVRETFEVYRSGWKIADELAESTGEVVHLAVDQANSVHYLYVARGGSNSIQTTTPAGSVQMLHATAAGNAILAHYDTEAIDRLIEDVGLPPLTENTITDRDDLLAKLESVRDQGYAINNEEQVQGAESIATAIHHPEGRVLGAVCVSGPSARFVAEYEEEMISRATEAANRIEIQVN